VFSKVLTGRKQIEILSENQRIGGIVRAKLYIYPYRITQRKPHPILWSFDTEALDHIAKNFKNKSLFSVEVKEKTLILRLIEEPAP